MNIQYLLHIDINIITLICCMGRGKNTYRFPGTCLWLPPINEWFRIFLKSRYTLEHTRWYYCNVVLMCVCLNFNFFVIFRRFLCTIISIKLCELNSYNVTVGTFHWYFNVLCTVYLAYILVAGWHIRIDHLLKGSVLFILSLSEFCCCSEDIF